MTEAELFEGITKEHIVKAIELINGEGYPPTRRSSTYDLVYNSTTYPPKYVLSLAAYIRNKQYIAHNRFSGGENSAAFSYMRKFGFDIKPKSDTKTLKKSIENPSVRGKYLKEDDIQYFIDQYKKLINGQLQGVKYGEIYKWETIQHFQDNWTDSHTGATILDVLQKSFNKDNNNLWSGQNFFPYRMLIQFAEKDSTAVSAMFKDLYNESKPLEERFKTFYAKADELLRRVFPEDEKSHYQSDRVLILYLALRYPNKYYLYKSGMFRTFCELTSFWEFPKTRRADTFTKVKAYIEMCEALHERLIADTELIKMHKELLPASITFNDNYHVLTQDFIYVVTTYLNPELARDGSELDEQEFLTVLGAYSNEQLSFYFNTLDKILTPLKLTQPNERIAFSCKQNQLSFIIGHRYGFVLFEDGGNAMCGAMSSRPFGHSAVPFGNGSSLFYSKLTSQEVEENMLDIQAACLGELSRVVSSQDAKNNNPYFAKAAFDKEYRNKILNTSVVMAQSMSSLNQIFFGPPGTGKTYHTVNEAVRIVDPEFYAINEKDRDKLKERFRELLIKDWNHNNGQIAFCTFHQSFSYEDFVEGIKPEVSEDKQVLYKVKDGIFKLICRRSEFNEPAPKVENKGRIFNWDEETFKRSSFYKMSLGNINNPDDDQIYDYCVRNNCIALGFGGYSDFTGMDEAAINAKGVELQLKDFAIAALNRFINYLKVGNYVIISKGNRFVRAIAKVTGEYKFDPGAPDEYYHIRNVQWVVVNQDIPITEVYNRNLIAQTIYKINEDGLKKEFFVKTGQVAQTSEAVTAKNYVLIIDEINRGNVSSIFGELITLIEKDKRAGGDEELEVTLPYSKEPFKVPDNVYIIGTMNTADRSIEALDTALRRRFSFREMPAKSKLIKDEGKLKPSGKVGNIDVVALLETINERIGKLIDKDHKIGHAYFMEVRTDEDLRKAFHDKVIPLLQEYFFGDFGKIGLVLGNSFVEKVNDEFEFAPFSGYDEAVIDDLKERPVFRIKKQSEWNFASIYE